MGPPTITGYRGWVAVPHNDGVTGSERVGPKHQERNSRGLFCRNRRVLGRKQCVRGGRYRKDCPGSESSKQAGGAGGVVCQERPEVHADRPGSRATVAVVASLRAEYAKLHRLLLRIV